MNDFVLTGIFSLSDTFIYTTQMDAKAATMSEYERSLIKIRDDERVLQEQRAKEKAKEVLNWFKREAAPDLASGKRVTLTYNRYFYEFKIDEHSRFGNHNDIDLTKLFDEILILFEREFGTGFEYRVHRGCFNGFKISVKWIAPTEAVVVTYSTNPFTSNGAETSEGEGVLL